MGGDFLVGGFLELHGLDESLPFVSESKEDFGSIHLGLQIVGIEFEGFVEIVEGFEAVAHLEMEGAESLQIVKRGCGESGEGVKDGEGDVVDSLPYVGIGDKAEIVEFVFSPA